MVGLKKDGISTGKESGFDNEADFIPFDLSDVDEDIDTSRPDSRASYPTGESVTASKRGVPALTNGEERKRKRKQTESSPERGPPTQRPKLNDPALNPWQTDLNAYASLIETARMLHKELEDFSEWMLPTSKEHDVRAYVVKRVVDAIESASPHSRAHPFGSFSTKLYGPDADIDMVVDRPGHIWATREMRMIGRMLERKGIGRNFQYIFSAKVPIIKFIDTYARIDLDLSFNQTNALQVVTLVKQYLRDMPAVRPLVMILKTLFYQKNLSVPAEGGLGSYSIICMVISFLQRHPKIAAGHIKAEENLGVLLIEILELYGTRFNFDRVGIAIDHGGSYFEKLDYQALNVNMWRRICVRDPNDPNNNIAKASHQTDSIIKVFHDAYRDLTNRCYLVDASIKRGETAPWVTNCGSILDAIIESPQVVGRERLSGLWKDDWEDAPDPKPPIPTPPASNSSNKDKSARKKQQALQKAAKKRARKQKAANDIQPSIIIPPATKSSLIPIKRKAPTAVSSNGTKDTPIVLDDSSPTSPPPARPKSNSPRKKKKSLTLETVDQAITNLEATGSISGRARNTITID